MTTSTPSVLNLSVLSSSTSVDLRPAITPKFLPSNPINCPAFTSLPKPSPRSPIPPRLRTAATPMAAEQSGSAVDNPDGIMKLLFVEMGVGYDQHGQDINAAATRACRDAISSNSIPAFRRGSIPGVSFEQMKLQIKLGVPHSLQHGKIVSVEVVDGGLICSSGVHVEEMGDKNDDCYIVNAAVYVGY
ncbi:unnamed protein product [Linum tenue]|uniref:Uncharacterized protein n=1 Tax=Linum tenue TaxID=586396 RepID=A0AAV0MFI4_9ROSI|nr:unnamed protein product [Linum tenue]